MLKGAMSCLHPELGQVQAPVREADREWRLVEMLLELNFNFCKDQLQTECANVVTIAIQTELLM